MTFSEQLDRSLVDKVVLIYVPSGKSYKGILKELGESYIKVNDVYFNTNQIVSISEVVRRRVT